MPTRATLSPCIALNQIPPLKHSLLAEKSGKWKTIYWKRQVFAAKTPDYGYGLRIFSDSATINHFDGKNSIIQKEQK